MYPDVFVHREEHMPKEYHWAILRYTSICIPGDEPSRTNPGHGYPEENQPVVEYEAFLTEEKWLERIKQLKEHQDTFTAMEVRPATVETRIEVRY